MSSLARRTLRTSAVVAGAAALGAGFAGQALAAPSLPELPAAPELAAPELAAPELAAPELPSLDALALPGVFNFEMPTVTTQTAPENASAVPASMRTAGLPAGPELPALPALPGADALALPELGLPEVPGAPDIAGELATPAGSIPLAGPALPELGAPALPELGAPALPELGAPALPELGAPALPALGAPQLPALPSTQDQDFDGNDYRIGASDETPVPAPADLASQIAGLAAL
ncbi:MAG: hypothetical protein OJJ54_01575 [Pseudonocardia sp.]|nr:hypothetical protein [Pseudonocardia sp.]